MHHAERAGDAPPAAGADVMSPAAGLKIFVRAPGHAGKDHADPGGRDQASRTKELDDKNLTAGEEGDAKPRAGVHAAHSGQPANPVAFVNLIFESGQSFQIQPSSAVAPVIEHGKKAVVNSLGKREEVSHSAEVKPGPGEAAASGSTDMSTQGDDVTPLHAAPQETASRTASSAGPATAAPPDVKTSPLADPQAGSPSAPLAPANSTIAITGARSSGFSGASATPEARAKLVGADSKVTLSDSHPGQPRLALAAQISAMPSFSGAPMPGSPAAGALPMAPGQATIEAGQTASPSPAGAPVPATPSALAAAVLAMQKAGDHRAILSLDPAGLGSMTVHVSIGQGSQVNVQFVPSLPQTAHLLTSHLDDLRQAMTEAGISLGQTSVGSDGGNASGNGGGQFSQAPRSAVSTRPNQTAQAVSHIGGGENRAGGVSAYA
jgi:flagellar hook-length control protein FliK